MTPVETLRALLAKATPGPWVHKEAGVYGVTLDSLGGVVCAWDDLPLSTEDAALIVAAVNALPALLDVAEWADKRFAAERDHELAIETGDPTGPTFRRLKVATDELRVALAKLRSK